MPKGPHYRVTIHGTFGPLATPYERWQTGVNVDTDSPPQVMDGVTLKTSAQAIYDSFVANVSARLQGPLVLEACDIRYIGNDGRQPRAADGSFLGAARFAPTAPTQVLGPPKYPFQVAMVASLLTARSGPEGKGRMFLPASNAPLDADGRISAAVAEQVATGVAAYLGTINAQFIENVAVVSSKGFTSDVTGVRVGRVLDTHRSRRSDQIEAHSPVRPVAGVGAAPM